MHPDAAHPVPDRGSEGERPVRVADDDDGPGGRRRQGVGCFIEEQAIGGVRRVQLRSLDIGMPRQRAEVEIHGPHGTADMTRSGRGAACSGAAGAAVTG